MCGVPSIGRSVRNLRKSLKRRKQNIAFKSFYQLTETMRTTLHTFIFFLSSAYKVQVKIE